MKQKDPLSRITFDIPLETHKRLKAVAAISGQSMRTIIVDSIEKELEFIGSKSLVENLPRYT